MTSTQQILNECSIRHLSLTWEDAEEGTYPAIVATFGDGSTESFDYPEHRNKIPQWILEKIEHDAVYAGMSAIIVENTMKEKLANRLLSFAKDNTKLNQTDIAGLMQVSRCTVNRMKNHPEMVSMKMYRHMMKIIDLHAGEVSESVDEEYSPITGEQISEQSSEQNFDYGDLDELFE